MLEFAHTTHGSDDPEEEEELDPFTTPLVDEDEELDDDALPDPLEEGLVEVPPIVGTAVIEEEEEDVPAYEEDTEEGGEKDDYDPFDDEDE